MRLNINRIVKNNLYFFLLWLIFINLFYTNIEIFEYTWKEKLYWQNMRTDENEHWAYQTYFSLEDFQKYGNSDIRNYILYLKGISIVEVIYTFLILLLFILHVLIPLVFREKMSLTISLIIDILAVLLFFVFFNPLLETPKIGVIPLYIFIPLVFSALLAFRIYQYRKKLIY